MKYPHAYLTYLVEFHGSRDYFECHEILEEYWKEVDPRNRSSHWVGLIQIAVAMYHYRRGNLAGATRTIQKATTILTGHLNELHALGLDASKLLDLLEETTKKMNDQEAYQSIYIPILDTNLSEQCQKLCAEVGYTWMNDRLIQEQIINKHLLRDRSSVIEERQQQLHKRLKKKQGQE